MPESAYGKWIDNNLPSFWALKDLTRNEPFWHQHKKGSSWIDAKIAMKFYYETINMQRNRREVPIQFIRVSTSYFMFLLRYGSRRKKMGRRNSCAGSKRIFFGMCCYHKCVQPLLVLHYFAMVDCLESFALRQMRKTVKCLIKFLEFKKSSIKRNFHIIVLLLKM